MKASTVILMLIILFSFHLTKSYAQSDTTEKVRKNELGLSVGPILLVTLGSTPYAQPIGITYKRVLGKWALRSNFTLRPWEDSWPGFENETKQISDSMQVRRNTNRDNISYIGRVGYEYRYLSKRGWYIVGGIDLQAQQTIGGKKIQQALYKIDSVSNAGTAEPQFHTTFINSEVLLTESWTTTQLGLGLSMGVMIPAGKRWWISALCRADTFFGPTRRVISDYVEGSVQKYNTSTFDFTSGPALTEISIYFRF